MYYRWIGILKDLYASLQGDIAISVALNPRLNVDESDVNAFPLQRYYRWVTDASLGGRFRSFITTILLASWFMIT